MEAPVSTENRASGEEEDYLGIKRRCTLLEEENAQLASNLLRARRLIHRLGKERSFILGRLLQYEGWEASDSGTDTDSSEEEEEEERIEESESSSDSELSEAEVHPPPSKRRRGTSASSFRRDRMPSPREDFGSNESASDTGLCIAVVKKRPCKSKALFGYKHCWHHAPLDPNSQFTWCQFVDVSKKKNKTCSFPVPKTKAIPFCKYHEQRMEDPHEAWRNQAANQPATGEPETSRSPPQDSKKGTPRRGDTTERPSSAPNPEYGDDDGAALMITEDDSEEED